MVSTIQQSVQSKTRSIIDLYKSVRARTMQIVAPLEIEDYVIQTAEYMSPPRWHIGHTSWFFETLLQDIPAGIPGLFRGIPLLLQFLLRRIRRAHRTAQARHEIEAHSQSHCCLSQSHRRTDAEVSGNDWESFKRRDYSLAGPAGSRTRDATPGIAGLRHQAPSLRSV